MGEVSEWIDQVFAKTSPKGQRLFLIIENERFGLVFAESWVYNSGTVVLEIKTYTYCTVCAFILTGNRKVEYCVKSTRISVLSQDLDLLPPCEMAPPLFFYFLYCMYI
jgi:hypothetical protein